MTVASGALPWFSAQYRGNGKPFIAHLVGTASLLVSRRAPLSQVLAALLHATYQAGDLGVDAGHRQTPARRAALRNLVGNSPMLTIQCEYRGRPRVIYAKAEHLNMTGSIKDRMALHIIRQGYARGRLEPGAPIVEATSGNTGIALAMVGAMLGYDVVVIMPKTVSVERRSMISSFGARLELLEDIDDMLDDLEV